MKKMIKQTVAMFICLTLFLSGRLPDVSASEYGVENELSALGESAVQICKPSTTDTGVTTWDCIWFGNYWQYSDSNNDGKVTQEDNKDPIKWRVLDVDEDGIALLLSDKIIDIVKYTSSMGSEWETCDLRSFLNCYDSSENDSNIDFSSNGFLLNAFSEEERTAIEISRIVNSPNPISENGGGDDTYDRIFLLSTEEAMTSVYGFVKNEFVSEDGYYHTDEDITREAIATKYTSEPRYADCVESWMAWYLRTTGGTGVFYGGAVYAFAPSGYNSAYDHVLGVRPAIRIKLDDHVSCWNYAGTVCSNGVVHEKGRPGEGTVEEKEIEEIAGPEIEDAAPTWDCIWFGNYWQDTDSNKDGDVTQEDRKDPIKWRVLTIDENGEALLLSDMILDYMQYHDTNYMITWEECALRSFLNSYGTDDEEDNTNDGFYNNAFSSAEKDAILSSNVINDDNPVFNTAGGNDTTDKIFCLSLAEATDPDYGFKGNDFLYTRNSDKYTESTSSRVALRTNFVNDKTGEYVYKNLAWTAIDWWLRTPGNVGGSGRRGMTYVGIDGAAHAGGSFTAAGIHGVRPALRMNLKENPSLWSYAGTVCADGVVKEIAPSNTSGPDDPDDPEPENVPKKPKKTSDGVTTWACLYFGKYWQYTDSNGDGKVTVADKKDPVKWRILDIDQDENALLLSDQILDIVEYNTEDRRVTWQTSTIRSFLNNYSVFSNQAGKDFSGDGFLRNAFTEAERNAILSARVVNDDNPVWETDAGDDTYDKVFCLSISEAMNPDHGFIVNDFREMEYNSTYTDDDQTRVAYKTNYVQNKDGYHTNKMTVSDMWWLRSPGRSNNDAAYISQNGGVYPYGEFVDYNHVCVRPAIRINLASSAGLWTYAGKVKSNESKTVIGFSGKEIEFDWNIDKLLNNVYSEKTDKNLAIGALALSSSAYDSCDAVDDTLKRMGLLEEISDRWRWQYKYYEMGTAHTIALRQYEKEGQVYNLITIVIRGTQDLVKDGITDIFIPFEADAANILNYDVVNFLTDRDIDIRDNKNRFFVTGHSLGGADANNLAAALHDSYGIDGKHITCYTFASPFSIRETSGNKWFIKNYINEDDWVPNCPQYLVTLRHGIDREFTTVDSVFAQCYKDLTGKNFSVVVNQDSNEHHMTETYMAWLLSESRYVLATQRRIAIIRCPVDVKLVDRQGNVIGSIINNTVGEVKDENVLMFAVGDEKCIVLPADSQYCLDLVGTDNGTMTYGILDYSYDNSGQVTDYAEKTFESVILQTGKRMNSDVGSDAEADEVKLYVLDENDNKVKEINEDGTEKDIPNGFYITGIDENGYTYTGFAIKPVVKVFCYNTLLVENKDYTISYSNNTNVGTTALITLRGKGNYSGMETETFKITEKDIGDADITVSEIADANHNNKPYKPVPTITYGKKKLVKNKDFTIEYHERTNTDEAGPLVEPKEPGKYYAVIEGKENYRGCVNVPFEIYAKEKVLVSKLKIDKIPDQPYNDGNPVLIPLSVKDGGPLTQDTHFTVATYKNAACTQAVDEPSEIGTYYVKITGVEASGYVGSRTVSFKITGIPMNKVTLGGTFQGTMTYSGSKLEQDEAELKPYFKSGAGITQLIVKTQEEYEAITDPVEKRNVDCIVDYKNNIKAGTATMILTGINGCTGTFSKTFKIAPFDIAKDPKAAEKFRVTLKNPPAENKYPYAKAGTKPEVTVEFKVGEKWIPCVEKTDYTLSYVNNTALNEGNNTGKLPTVKVTGKGNFKGTDASATFKIVGTDMETAGVKVIAADVVSQTATNKWKTKKVTLVDKDGKTLKAGTDYQKVFKFYKGDETTPLADTAELAPGDEIRIEVTGAGNYSGPITGKYRIGKYDISKMTASLDPKKYTGKEVFLSAGDIIWKAVKNQPAPTFEFDVSTYKNHTAKGKATVDVVGTGDYCGRKTITFTIGPKNFIWWWRNLSN
ncbi:MAG: hypothetical protein J5518_01700 [Lachnospiraceae bacterium]|nr:hypothetical protein [Lachnospiraceae bacterium]